MPFTKQCLIKEIGKYKSNVAKKWDNYSTNDGLKYKYRYRIFEYELALQEVLKDVW